MCGIVAVTGYKKALPLLINGLEKLEYKGYDSTSIAIKYSETHSNTNTNKHRNTVFSAKRFPQYKLHKLARQSFTTF